MDYFLEIKGLNPREDDHYSEDLTPCMLCMFAICRLQFSSSRLTFSKCIGGSILMDLQTVWIQIWIVILIRIWG